MDPESEPNPIPPEPEPPGTGHILDLSDELLLQIVSYLGQPSTIPDDHINLAQSCTRFDNLLQDAPFCRRINVPWNTYIERCNLVKYLAQPVRAEIMTELNLNDLYWIPSGDIKDLALKLNNLKGLHVLGTLLNFGDLQDILLKLSLRDLSWSWKIGRDTDESNYDILKSDELSEKLSQLRKLCLFIPPKFKMAQYVDSYPYLSICYFVSLCVGLEKLWLFSCDNGISEIFDKTKGRGLFSLSDWAPNLPTPEREPELFLGEMKFPNLVDFVYLFPERDGVKLYVPKLVSRILQGFGVTGELEPQHEQDKSMALVQVPRPAKPKQLWIDHPQLNYHCSQASALNFFRPGWPQMDLSNLESIAFPLFPEVVNVLFPTNAKPDLSKCKHIQISHGTENGLPVILNGYFDSAINLESFLAKTWSMGYGLDWNAFVENHPKITLVNVCDDENFVDPYFCIALSKLTKLKRISVPIRVLYEIRGAKKAIRKFRILASSLEVDSSYSTNRPTGLDFLTHGCRDVEEFELGLESWPKLKSPYPVRINLNHLASISLWKNLKKLTLNLNGVINGEFMIEIARSCPLEILRFTIKQEEGHCKTSYIEHLCEALRFCQHLKDFRLEYTNNGGYTPIFQALQSCKKLERLVIISNRRDPYRRITITNAAVVKLMKICTKLSVLYLFLGGATKASCRSLQMELESMFKNSRPPLSIAIRNSMDHDPEYEFDYPAIHYRQMVVLSRQVEPYYDYPDKFVT